MGNVEESGDARPAEDRLEELQVIEAADLEQANAFHAFRFKKPGL